MKGIYSFDHLWYYVGPERLKRWRKMKWVAIHGGIYILLAQYSEVHRSI